MEIHHYIHQTTRLTVEEIIGTSAAVESQVRIDAHRLADEGLFDAQHVDTRFDGFFNVTVWRLTQWGEFTPEIHVSRRGIMVF